MPHDVWEDDLLQFEYVDLERGSNTVSLRQAQKILLSLELVKEIC
ncbi:CPCC family cysteine-rich protein [Haloimpatiens sp. FM7330]